MARVDLGSPEGDLFSTTAMRTNSWSFADDGCSRRRCQSAHQHDVGM